MITKIYLITSFLLLTLVSSGQKNFKLTDSTFEVEQTFTTHGIRFELNKPDLLLDSVCKPFVDSILVFLLEHPKMTVELGVHTASLGWEDRSFHLTVLRARSLYSYFVNQGVKETQIIPMGYECSEPIHRDPYINQFKEKNVQKYQELHQENRRVVLKILNLIN